MRGSRTSTVHIGRSPGLAVALVLLAGAIAIPVHASDPPHWYSSTIVIGCGEQCHATHNAAGGGLTQADSNVNLCQSCHNSAGLGSGLPINDAHSAVPGATGSSHAFDVPAVDATYGTQMPLDNEMSLRVMDGNLVCSTCHDQHKNYAVDGGRARIATPVRVADLGGTGTMSAGGAFIGANGMWYLVEIDGAGTQSTATFQWSKDNGTTWMNTGVGAGGGSPVALSPSGDGVEVTFGAGSYEVGDRWEFSAAYPFLRSALTVGNDGSVMCRDCHRSWEMTHTDVRTYDGTNKSHPVGVGLNANGRGYDRAAPLDGNGAPLIGGADQDGNPTNDFTLDGNNNVQCLTCHGVHYTDDNTLTVDQP